MTGDDRGGTGDSNWQDPETMLPEVGGWIKQLMEFGLENQMRGFKEKFINR